MGDVSLIVNERQGGINVSAIGALCLVAFG